VPDGSKNLDNWTLAEIKEWLFEHAEKGTDCPICERPARIYKRLITYRMVMALVNLLREDDWVHLPTNDESKEAARLRYWGMIEEQSTARPDGGKRGVWRIRPRGRLFLQGHLKVPKYAHVFGSKLLKFSGPQISVYDSVKTKKFDLKELLER
jgi:hypothetical protein